MKALVLEIKDGKAAVLREDGEVVLTDVPCSVGETIEVSAGAEERVSRTGALRAKAKRRKYDRRFMRTAAAAVVALCVAGGSFGYLNVSAESYVSVDSGDASVELAINHFGRVIAVNALNDESEELAGEVYKDVRGKKFDDAMEHTMEKFGERGAFDGETMFPGGFGNSPAFEVPAEVVIGIVANREGRREELAESIERCTGDFRDGGMFGGSEPPEFHTVSLDKKERGLAFEDHKSPGRYMYDIMEHPVEDGAMPPAPGGRPGPGGPPPAP